LLKNESLSNEKVKVAKEEEKPNLDVILRETRWPPGHPGVWAPSDSSSGLEFSRMGKQIDRKNVFSLSLSLSLSRLCLVGLSEGCGQAGKGAGK
jgi:hypothetical protein